MAKTCAVCGKPSSSYVLCRECNKLKNEGSVVKCETCNTWHKIQTPCKCAPIPKYNNSTPVSKTHSSYHKSKRKIEYRCSDGHMVKSKSERDIDNYLFLHKIQHVYEKEIHVNETQTVHPDFYLPEHDAYIEHWGYGRENTKYTEDKEKKMKFYRENGYTLICTYEDPDAEDIESALDYKLAYFKKGQINFEKGSQADIATKSTFAPITPNVETVPESPAPNASATENEQEQLRKKLEENAAEYQEENSKNNISFVAGVLLTIISLIIIVGLLASTLK